MAHLIHVWPLGVLAVLFQAHCNAANVLVPGLSYLPPSRDTTLIEVGKPAISVPASGPTLSTSFPAFDLPATGDSATGQHGGASSPSDGFIGTVEKGSLPPESCTEFCGFDYSPVCGSDGITYTNDCTFSVATCKNSNLIVAGNGPCAPEISSDSPQQFPLPPPPSLPAPSPSVPSPTRPPVVIPFPSDTPNFSSIPGSGVIPFPPSFASLGTSSAPDAQEEPLPSGGECSEACTRIYIPVCGTDGITYNNKCLLDVAVCKGRADGQNIGVAFEDICGDSISINPSLVESVDVRDSSAPISDGLISCDKKCTKIFNPVCGSDGNTYNSNCLLEVASCESVNSNAGPITLDYEGACVSTTPDRAGGIPDAAPQEALGSEVGSSGSPGDFEGQGTTGSTSSQVRPCREDCTKIFLPVCGSDGQTYNNECLLKAAACKSRSAGGSSLVLAFDGPCVAALPRGPVCNEMCDKTFLPVCGSDGETYNNICLLNVADCLTPFTTITHASDGPCESTSAAGLSTDPRPSVDTSPSQSAVDGLSTGVEQEYLPPV